MTDIQAVDAAVAAMVSSGLVPADVAVVLGSGLGGFAGRLTASVSVSSAEIPGWPPVGVVGHEGRLVNGTLNGRRVLVLSGRSHFYEGHTLEAVTFPARAVGRAGVPVVVLTNASGGINPAFGPGTVMVIDDHLNLMGDNPLRGRHDPRWGDRFPDMTSVYAMRLRTLADEAAGARSIPLAHGVYAAVAGPSYETPAEIRALRVLGADAVGMSTVPEAIVCRQMGVEVLGLSCVANAAAGMTDGPLSSEDVLAAMERAGGTLGDLLEEIIARL